MSSRNRLNRSETGRAAEEAAAVYLQGRSYEIEARNWRCRTGELDLIAWDGSVLVFVEVRSRTSPSRFGTAVEAVTPLKCRQVRETAEVYLKMTGSYGSSVRFDVVAVTFGADGSVRELKHIPGAF
ncbi:YraN family protein [Cohnella sp. CFH 77786]|uniref:YraN family protein n=1 Tax=Cohnella sp. CFH 77786 TaxID=2662265 RepID=UPI001C60B78F|nr:YraN family protein [Cohnella sp. CFH 77786]MBW5444592.1 YraN family protein [Cohnella sp. CFH 77786]